MKIYSAYKTDEQLEEDGQWFDFEDGGRMRIARLGNPRHSTRVEQLQEPFKSYLVRGQNIPKEDAREILLKAVSETIVVGWEGMTDDKGKTVNYSHEAAYKALKGQRDLLEEVLRLAGERSNYMEALDDEIEKKSSSISSIDSPGPANTSNG